MNKYKMFEQYYIFYYNNILKKCFQPKIQINKQILLLQISFIFLQVNKLFLKNKKIKSSQANPLVSPRTIKQFETFSVILHLIKLYKCQIFICQLYFNLKYYPSIIFLSFCYLS
ncbi:hypothetical protein TTHERM_000637618 (macronuclear) [Tetrahymena thermophila SB210]|uniref:Uncharacterized protein n=1 Tax=Tetrahymena thermophila (strain SB210) TaxID=312017 RepID=W7X179_TETTS|nr:hypothetical protein TTHERM_000637618 [Tetrahymena thermophila SB210]EWS72970.1 hypothetical protein TTHERM_000637618 [Tetrahymena thermophila SB210]|eukprot:XP_012654503.1 hypothetical protein TTHERM_000637618 [Tetrahymena thermophila SB210]